VQANTFTVHGLLSRATEARGAVYSFSEPFVPLPWSNASGRFRAFGRVPWKKKNPGQYSAGVLVIAVGQDVTRQL
jgi:hypothetical protein